MPVGWSMRSKRVLAEVRADSSGFIQSMNDRYTKPSGNEAQLEDAVEKTAQDVAVETLQPLKSESS